MTYEFSKLEYVLPVLVTALGAIETENARGVQKMKGYEARRGIKREDGDG